VASAEGQLLGRQAGDDPVDDLADPAEGTDEQLGAVMAAPVRGDAARARALF